MEVSTFQNVWEIRILLHFVSCPIVQKVRNLRISAPMLCSIDCPHFFLICSSFWFLPLQSHVSQDYSTWMGFEVRLMWDVPEPVSEWSYMLALSIFFSPMRCCRGIHKQDMTGMGTSSRIPRSDRANFAIASQTVFTASSTYHASHLHWSAISRVCVINPVVSISDNLIELHLTSASDQVAALISHESFALGEDFYSYITFLIESSIAFHSK